MSVLTDLKKNLKQLATNSNAEILAVSKMQPIEKVVQAFNENQIHFAENYVQEALAKQEQLNELPIRWHFIGHLQKNKVKLIVGKFVRIHSVDSLELAQKISSTAKALNCTQAILLQVNVAREESKGGFLEEQLDQAVDVISKLPNIIVSGFMTMPPLVDDAELNRIHFKKLKSLADKYKLSELSMGTSSDYQVALEEGSTWIRLGTVLFGERVRKDT